jgi:hypothetical protein
MCWRDANTLVEKLDGIFDAGREANPMQFLYREQRVIEGVKSTYKIKKDNARPIPLLACLYMLIA